MFSQCTDTNETQTHFYLSLTEDLVDNVHENSIDSHRNPISEDVTHNGIELIDITGRPRYRVDAHLTPTRKRRKLRDRTVIFFLLQGRCDVCSRNTSNVCSQCKYALEEGENQVWLYHTKTNKNCFIYHLKNVYHM